MKHGTESLSIFYMSMISPAYEARAGLSFIYDMLFCFVCRQKESASKWGLRGEIVANLGTDFRFFFFFFPTDVTRELTNFCIE